MSEAASQNRVAIVGIGCRVPGARDAGSLWRLVRDGVDAFTDLSEAELLAAGVRQEALDDPAYVRRAPLLDDIDMFDAGFFGLSSEQADLLDPQHRLFFECAAEALEDAALGPDRLRGSVGVFGGCSISSYLLFNLLPSMQAGASAATLLAMIGNEKDYLATHLSYLLGFTGPSVGVQSACSTSLAAVHMACQSLLSGESDVALAGGASVRVPQRVGYLYENGSILSPGGRCRSFDAAADGTVFGSGVGVVVLRRLEDAVRDGDRIYSVILGSAMNNDGGRKAGYTAPSVDGQAAVIAEALAVAGVAPGSIGLIEAHGTGTPIGDPIEFKALSEVFRGTATAAIALACVKANLGHLEAAAGVTGLIAASMALRHAQLPPIAHFQRANPLLAMQASSFAVGTQARPWLAAPSGEPRRAGVSSFGIGGSNVHVVLEQAPMPTPSTGRSLHGWSVLCASARNEQALAQSVQQLISVLDDSVDMVDLAAASRATTFGRRAFEYRVAVIARDAKQTRGALAAATAMRAASNPRLALAFGNPRDPSANVAGIVDCARALSAAFPRIRSALDNAIKIVPGLRGLLEAQHPPVAASTAHIALQWAVLEQLRHWDVTPAVLAGEGLGELAAAAAAGMLSWPEVLKAIDLCGAENADPSAALAALRPSVAAAGSALLSWRTGQPLSTLTSEYLRGLVHVSSSVSTLQTALPGLGITALLRLNISSEAAMAGDGNLLQLNALHSGRNLNQGMLDTDPVAALMQTIASLHTHGMSPDWRKVLGSGPRAALPFYPFQRRRHWRETPLAATPSQQAAPHSGFPGVEVSTPLARRMLSTTLYPASARWLAEHRVDDHVVLPAAAYASLAIAAGLQQIGALSIERVLKISPQGTPLQTVLDHDGRVQIHAQVDGKWLRHASADGSEAVATDAASAELGQVDLAAATAHCVQQHDVERMHQRMRHGGIDLGPSLRRFVSVRSGPNEALARLRPADDLAADNLQLHPVILDALFQSLAVLVADSGVGAHLPVSFDALRLAAGTTTSQAVWCHARLRTMPSGAIGLIGDLALLNDEGDILLKVDGLACRPAHKDQDFTRHLYEPVWVARNHAFLTVRPPDQDSQLASEAIDLSEHSASLPGIDALSTAYVVRAFKQLGVQFRQGEIAALPIACEKKFERLLPRLWLMLQEDGVIDESHRVLKQPESDAEALYQALRLQHPGMLTELGMLARCGTALAEVLTGKRDPLALLFSSSGTDDAPALYAQSSYAGALNKLAVDLLTPLLQQQTKLNILEIGGGTGGTTHHLLPQLAGQASEYLFTDISPAFTEAAHARFGSHACLRTALLDIAHDPAAQGIEPGSRHLVIAANVLHATADLAATIANVKRTLAPGGWLLLVEGLRPSRWLDLTFALTDGWWNGTDRGLRPDYPFLDAQGWRDLLSAQGFESVTVHTPGAGRLADQGVIVARRRMTETPACVILRDALGAADSEHPGSACAAVLGALQNLDQQQRSLIVATRGARKIHGWEQPDPEQAAVSGLLKSAALERSSCAMRHVDLDPLAQDHEQVLAIEAALDDGETDTAWRDGQRYVLRLHRPEAAVKVAEVFRLTAAPDGSLDSLALEPATRKDPGPDEIEIRVVAAGLNFKDVLTLLGTVAASPAGLGGECAGVVTSVGANVTGFTTGQRVVALAGGSFASHVVVPACRVQLIPASLSFEQAAVLPVAGMTALHALRELVRIAPGQRVLIHAASGGVGLHCVALALHAGAEVFATAGSPVKRAYLRRLGVRQVFDSRSTAFAEQVRQASDKEQKGGGIDIVVNCLNGDAIAAGLSVLKRGGCFIELGRAGIWSAQEVANKFPHVDYRVVALDRISDQEGGRLLRAALAAAVSGEFAAPPITQVPMARAGEAFRLMQRARHIGRIALTVPHAFGFRADRSYLITGGLGGLGLALAEWAIERGARHLVLVSRGAPGGETVLKLAGLRALGAVVETEAMDVSSEPAVARLAATFGLTRPPLAAVFHAAGMLDDAPLEQQDAARLNNVRAAKLDAAELLAQHCKGLDAFVLFSSAAGLLGSAGQANHSAANAALDAFALRLHAQGITTMTINWGPWSEIGAAAKRKVGDRLAGSGMGEIKPADGLAALGWMLDSRRSQIAMLPIDWRVFSQRAGGSLPALFRELAPQPEQIRERKLRHESGRTDSPNSFVKPLAAGSSGGKLAAELNALAPARRGPWVESLVADVAQRLIGSSALPPERALTELGLDSLLAIELRNRLGALIGASLPATLIFDHPSIRALGGHLHQFLSAQLETQATVPATVKTIAPQAISPGAANVANAEPVASSGAMSEEQVMALDSDALDAILRDLQSRHLKS
ncbi:hypothetical protein BH11PSE11_BH11PSE11_04990 [soil metagenome]